MSGDAPVAPPAPATAGDSRAAIAASAARLRELERRAFARPDSPAAEVDSAAAAVELAELRARTVAPALAATAASAAAAGPASITTTVRATRPDASDGDPEDDAYDPELDDQTLGERLAAAATTALSRLRALPPRTVRIVGVSALVAGVLVAACAAAYAALTAPPPAYAIFAADEKPSGDRVSLVTGDSVAWSNELEQRGTIVLEGPHLFGERDDPVRVGVYREWLDADRIEVCAALVVSNSWSLRTACTTEADFRREGVGGVFDQEGAHIDFAWMPDGEVVLESELTGASTLEEVRALALPAVAAIEAAGLDLDVAREVAPFFPGVLAGPLELGQVDRWRFFGIIVETDAAPWESAPRPQICLAARDDRTRADGSGIVVGCATAERFAAEGLSVQTDDGLIAQWDADNVFDAELP